MNSKVKTYSPAEERINISSHAFGLLLSIAGLAFLVSHATACGDVWDFVSFSIFGSSLILVFAGSSIYDSARDGDLCARV